MRVALKRANISCRQVLSQPHRLASCGPPNVSITRSRGSGKTRSLTRTPASKTGQLNERERLRARPAS